MHRGGSLGFIVLGFVLPHRNGYEAYASRVPNRLVPGLW